MREGETNFYYLRKGENDTDKEVWEERLMKVRFVDFCFLSEFERRSSAEIQEVRICESMWHMKDCAY